MACKPGFVPMVSHGGRPFIWDARCRDTSRDRPGRLRGSAFRSPRRDGRPYLVLLPVGFTVPLPLPVARCALTAPFHPYLPETVGFRAGGLLSVALSLGSPPPDVIRHRTSVEPGLSSPEGTLGSGRPAIWRGRNVGRRRGYVKRCVGGKVKQRRAQVVRWRSTCYWLLTPRVFTRVLRIVRSMSCQSSRDQPEIPAESGWAARIPPKRPRGKVLLQRGKLAEQSASDDSFTTSSLSARASSTYSS